MDKETKRLIKSKLRMCFALSNRKRICSSKHRVHRGIYRCGICRNLFKKDKMEYDHIDPVFAMLDRKSDEIDWNGVIDRLFNLNNIQMLCIDCHDLKTSIDIIRKRHCIHH